MESELWEMMADGSIERRQQPAGTPITAQQLAAQHIAGAHQSLSSASRGVFSRMCAGNRKCVPMLCWSLHDDWI